MANRIKLEEIFKNPENVTAFLKLNSKEEGLAFLNGKGAEINEAELDEIINQFRLSLKKDDEAMDLDDLDTVAGGGFGSWFKSLINDIADVAETGAMMALSAADTVVRGAADIIGNIP